MFQIYVCYNLDFVIIDNRQSSLFCNYLWNECGRKQSGIAYDIMRKNRANYHYKLRALRKNKQNKPKMSVSKTMLRNSQTTYWKSIRAIRKHNYNTTQVVDGTSGDSNIANIFRRKYKSLFNSVGSSDEEIADLN